MDKPFGTGLSAFARFIYESKILCYAKEGEIKPLLFRSVETEVSDVWKELKEDRESDSYRAKKPNKNYHNDH